MIIEPTEIDGVTVVRFEPVADHRGSFRRIFCSEELAPLIGGRRVVQINHSMTRRVGAVRGLHFQRPPHAEMKLVQALRGKVWDVAVDLRAGSPTFLRWHAEQLSPGGRKMLVIPEGCAHGFQVLEPDSELLYFHTAPYCKELEGGGAFNDPMLRIKWPLEAVDISERDLHHPSLGPDYSGIEL